MMSALYSALISVKVDPDLAQKAADEISHLDTRLAKIEATSRLHTWMLGAMVTLLLASLYLQWQTIVISKALTP